MICENCGDPATNFLPHLSEAVRLMTESDGDFLCNDCYIWIESMGAPTPNNGFKPEPKPEP